MSNGREEIAFAMQFLVQKYGPLPDELGERCKAFLQSPTGLDEAEKLYMELQALESNAKIPLVAK